MPNDCTTARVCLKQQLVSEKCGMEVVSDCLKHTDHCTQVVFSARFAVSVILLPLGSRFSLFIHKIMEITVLPS